MKSIFFPNGGQKEDTEKFIEKKSFWAILGMIDMGFSWNFRLERAQKDLEGGICCGKLHGKLVFAKI